MSKQENNNIIPEIVENSNDRILKDISVYLEFIRGKIQEIIKSDGLKYSDPMDKKKIYPDFTYTQFLYLLSRLYDTVYSVNLELLCKPCIYNTTIKPQYNVEKVKMAYNVYFKLCQFYGFSCAADPFFIMTGIDKGTLQEWLSSGKSDLYNIMRENARNLVISRFENSSIPLLQLAAANHKYNLATPENTRQEAAAVDVLPDLLALTDNKKPPMIEEK